MAKKGYPAGVTRCHHSRFYQEQVKLMSTWFYQFIDAVNQRDLAMIGLASLGILALIAAVKLAPEHNLKIRLTKPWLVLAGLAVLGLLARLAWIGASPWWYDESYTALVMRLNIPERITATALDVHPPLYYLSGNWDAALGLRLNSVLWFFLALGLFILIARQYKLGSGAFLLASGIVILMPSMVYFSQESRMYTLLVFFVLLAFWSLTGRDYIGLAIASLLMAYTHNYGLIFAGIFYLIGLAEEIKRPVHISTDPFYKNKIAWHEGDQSRLGWLLGSGVAVALLYLPWAVTLLAQMKGVAAGYWIQPVSLGETLYALFESVMYVTYPESAWAIIPAGIALGAILSAVTYYGYINRRYALLAWFWGPVVVSVVISLLWHPILLWRGLIPCIPALALILAEGITKDRRAWAWALPAGAVLAMGLVWLIGCNATGHGKENRVVIAEPPPGARLIHINDSSLVPWLAYRPDLNNYSLLTNCPNDPGGLSPQLRKALGVKFIKLADLKPGDLIAAKMGPLSTACEEDLYKQLINQSSPVTVKTDELEVNGVWKYGKQ